ncbi:MAG: hypothetical protein IPP59_15675 [Betaproteobacteria bacterium]|jgi:hypothetical protein|nr:hypothetical protein [Betaproteobacteria bacterium]MBK8319503.1 hypothetical protein [Betaproteobacteria bacterium]MBK9785496.1 hypothetical protein [Candidatus Dechloromonas phosphorivorans]
MYIIAIGWLYVTVLIAANEPSIVAGIISFLFYGLVPCSLLLWISASKVRRQRKAYQELLANQRLNDGNGSDTESNQ